MKQNPKRPDIDDFFQLCWMTVYVLFVLAIFNYLAGA